MAAASESDLFSQFAVDGLALGAKINPGGGAYREYKCGPSEQFAGFTYCTRRVTGPRGESSFTILHDDERRTHYVTRTLWPAQFGPGDIDREIRRLSDTFGLRATRLQGPPGTPARASVIAYWGPLELQRLDAETVGRIAAGIPSKAGMLVDFLGNFQRSAREGLPLYALRGGYGYIYVASALDDDIPKLRLTAANPAVFVVRPPTPAAPTQSPLAFAEQERARTDALEAMRAATETRRQEEESRRLALEAQRRDAAQARKEAEQKQREEERRARFARLSDPARQLVADTSATISANPGMANLLDYVDQLAQLNDALGKGDPDALEKRVATLSAALKNEPAYAEMIRRRQEEKDRQTALRLGRSQEVLKQRRAEVMRYLAEEPASSAAAAFLPLLRQIEPAMQTGTLDAVEPLSEKIELTIRQNNLEQRFARYAATPPPAATNGPALPRTPRTAVLLDGDADDLALFYNSSKTAPNVARNLRGDLDFANGIARVCIFQDAADERLKQEARDLTRAQSATAIDVVAPCPAATLASADIVALHRGSFLRLDSSKALSLIQLVEAGDYKPVTAKAGEARRQEAAERQRVGAEIEAGIVAKTRVGFGLLTLPTASSALCAILPDQIDGHRESLRARGGKLIFAMNKEPEIIANDADETFRRVQRDQCGAVYAGAETLATLVEALKRESIAYAFSPIWIEPDAITSAQKAYAERKEAAAQAEADDRRKLADAAALEAQRAKDLSESESGRQAELRKEFGAKAKDAAERVAKLARAWIDGENAPVGRLYPQFARWLQTRRDDHWQIESVNSTIADYGVARWKDRPVEAAATTLTLRMKNRLLGEYADACFTLGIVLDDEFQELRAPLEAPCAQTSVFAAWRRDNRFESRWLIGAR